MKHLKSVLIIALTVFIAGIVIWQLTWMKGIERKFKEEQLSGGAKNNTEVKEKPNKDHKVKVEAENAGPDVSIAVPKKQVPVNQEGQAEQENEKPGNSKVKLSAELPVKETSPELIREPGGRWFEKDINLGKKNVKARSETGKSTTETLKSKTITVTTKNKARQIKQNITSPLPSPPTTGKYDVNTPAQPSYPTSTAP